MTSLERAKRFIQNKSSLIALTIVPLASLTMVSTPAKAGATAPLIFGTAGASCVVSGTGQSTTPSPTTCNDAALSTGSNGVTGIKLFGTSSVTSSSGGTGQFGLEYLLTGTTNSGTFSGTIPVDWTFTLASSDSNPVNWTIDFLVNSVNVLQRSGSTPFGSGGHLVSGSATTSAFTINGVATGFQVELFASEGSQVTAPNSGTITVASRTITSTVPPNSININTAQVSGTPEPSSFLLMAPAAGLLAWLRRRKKQA